MRDPQARDIEMEGGGKRLELEVPDAGDGTNSDWGVRLASELRR